MQPNEPEISFQQRFNAFIDDYVRDVKRIWPLNSKRSPLHIWMEVVARATKVCEGVRKHEWDIVVHELAALTMWWFAFIGRLNDLDESSDLVIFRVPNTAGDILWRNYPQICPVCVAAFVDHNPGCQPEEIISSVAMGCTCFVRRQTVENRTEETKQLAQRLTKEISRLRYDAKPRSLLEFEKMFAGIYYSNIYTLTPEEIGFHLLEEVGEVSSALVDATFHERFIIPSRSVEVNLDEFLVGAKKKAEHIEKELADVFSWIIALLEKAKQTLLSASRLCVKFNEGIIQKEVLNQLLETLSLPTEGLNIVDIIWRVYEYKGRLGHKRCRSNICVCNQEAQLLLEGEHLPNEVRKALASRGPE